MAAEKPTTWKSYEEVARYLLGKMGDTLGLGLESVEGKQKLVGESGADWEIDGKGVKADGGAIVIVECRRYTTSRVKQGAVAQLAWTISDLGASGGIIVTPIGVQKGGRLIAKSAGIQIVHLDAASTTTDYVLKFLNKVHIGASGAMIITATATGTSTSPGPTPRRRTPERIAWLCSSRGNMSGLPYPLPYIPGRGTASSTPADRWHGHLAARTPVGLTGFEPATT